MDEINSFRGISVGDMVVCVSDLELNGRANVFMGDIGVVRHIRENSRCFEEDKCVLIGVEWESAKGHNLNGRISSGRGWYVFAEELQVVKGDLIDDDIDIDESDFAGFMKFAGLVE